MNTNDYLEMLKEIEELGQLATRENDPSEDRVAKEPPFDETDTPVSDDLDSIPIADWFDAPEHTQEELEKACQCVGWAVYLATRSGYGEAALAYLTINGQDAFIERCRTELLPHFDQTSSPLLPSGSLIGPFRLASEDDQDGLH